MVHFRINVQTVDKLTLAHLCSTFNDLTNTDDKHINLNNHRQHSINTRFP